MKGIVAVVLVPVLLLVYTVPVLGHCEIPCGIYGDDARLAAIGEDLQTIEKSMKMIVELSADPAGNMNQVVRWVTNKEAHAEHIQTVVAQYFLAQRVKTPDSTADKAVRDRYASQLVVLHKMIVTAMKCKQTTDLTQVEKLHGLVHEFQEIYKK